MSDHLATRWDVYRDDHGEPVTITEQQMHAIWHAIGVVQQVRRAEDARPIGEGNWHADLYKSRLLGRMVLDGKPPYDEKPPTEVAACAYWLWDYPTPAEHFGE